MGIKISPQHGVNPTISVCFWCGENKNEIALVGRLKGDVQAPMRAVLDYVPCEKCAEKMNAGVTLMEASMTPMLKGFPSVKATGGEELYLTGRYVVVKTEVVYDLLKDRSIAEWIIKSGKTYVDTEAFNGILANAF